MTKYEILTTQQVGQRVGLTTDAIRKYRLRGTMIEPDGYLGTCPYWSSIRIDQWNASRRKRGQRGPAVKKAS